MPSLDEFERSCFVIMPFGRKPVGGKTVDFDTIFDQVFEPAIRAAKTESGEALVPRRTDQEAFSSSINQDMYDYILYCRMALADVSGSNPNALYELGARHALQDAGTVILRQKGHTIPYDIRTIKVFEYDFEGDIGIEASQAHIANVLTETLKRNRLDSPIRQALGRQFQQRQAPETPIGTDASGAEPQIAQRRTAPDLDSLLRDAEDALLNGDRVVARTIHQVLLRIDPTHVIARMKLGQLLKEEGNVLEAHGELAALVRQERDYAEAWRELGVVESLIVRNFPEATRARHAQQAIRAFDRATTINPQDADAWASWGGILRRIGDEAGALEKYEKAAEISEGDSYPLLNAIKLRAKLSGTASLGIDPDLVAKAKRQRSGQATSEPPVDAPWCFFDLSTILMFEGDGEAALKAAKAGIKASSEAWMPKTFHDDLQQTLVGPGITLSGLDQIVAELKRVPDGAG
ncbi:MAG: tetratricopeptide repeat protein [Pseudomonadota bacterium]